MHCKAIFKIYTLYIIGICFGCADKEPGNSISKEVIKPEIQHLQNSDSVPDYDALMLIKQKDFKKWLIDTLKTLRSIRPQPIKDLFEVAIETSPDSLGLSILKRYHFIYSQNNGLLKIRDINVLMELLQEYDELPKVGSTISFVSNYSYQPTPVDGKSYEIIFKFDKIDVIEGTTKITYGYIRGRISDKVVRKQNEKGKVDKQVINFIWEEGRITKKVSI